jgi:hypothetical protein
MSGSGGSVSDAPTNKTVSGQRHQLAYITPDEVNTLVDQGGVPTMTNEGIMAYPGHYGGSSSSSSSSGPPGGGATSLGSGRDYSPPPSHSPPARHHAVDTPTQVAEQTQLDTEARARQFDYEGEAAGQGQITSNNYNAKTGTFDVQQTTGTISAVDYQKSNLESYLSSPDVSDKAKAKTLNQLQAIQNSQLVGTKQGKSDIQSKDFVLDNLSTSLDYVKGQTKYSKYTSMIDEEGTTYAGDFKENPLKTVVKSGGVVGTMVKGLYNNYQNKQAMKLLGYTGDVYNPKTGDYGEGNRMLTGGATGGEREAMTQLAPFAPYLVAGKAKPTVPSMAAQWFNQLGGNAGNFNLTNAYADAKAKQKGILGNSSAVGMLAANQTPYFDFLTKHNLTKGIL